MNKTEIINAIENAANDYNLNVMWGKEDGITWITMFDRKENSEFGCVAHPKNYELLARLVADTTGRNFYAASVRNGSIEGALDADFLKIDKEGVPAKYPTEMIQEYGEVFAPGEPGLRFLNNKDTGLPLCEIYGRKKSRLPVLTAEKITLAQADDDLKKSTTKPKLK